MVIGQIIRVKMFCKKEDQRIGKILGVYSTRKFLVTLSVGTPLES
jgi:hypothetical protein